MLTSECSGLPALDSPNKKGHQGPLWGPFPNKWTNRWRKKMHRWNNSPVTSPSSLVPGQKRNSLATFMSSNCIRM